MQVSHKNNLVYVFYEYIFYIFVFLLPWQTVWILREIFYGNEKWQYGTIGIYVSDIFIIIWLALGFILYKKQIHAFIQNHKRLIILISLFITWIYLSIIWSSDKTLALYYAIKISIAFDLFLFVQIVPVNLRAVSIVFVSSAFLQSIIGLYQFLSQKTFSQKFLGLQSHNVWQGGNSIVSTDSERWLRIYGGMPHPNIFGVLLLTALLLSIYLLITNKHKKVLNLFLLLSISLFTTNILLTFSRTIWLTSALSTATITLFLFINNKPDFKKIILPTLLIIFNIILIVSCYSFLFNSRITNDTKPTHNSVTDRVFYITQAKKMIKTHPIIGTGIGNYTKTAFENDLKKLPLWHYQPVHNIFYLTTAETGLVGLVFFLLFLIYIFYNFFYHQNKTFYKSTLFTIFVSFLFISFFDHWLITSHFGTLLFFLMSGLLLTKQKGTQTI